MKAIAAIAAAAVLGTMIAQPALSQSGPVARGCKNDIAKICADKPHDGSVRVCLEQAYEQASASCKKALDSTGGGRGKKLGMGKGQGKGQGQGKGAAGKG